MDDPTPKDPGRADAEVEALLLASRPEPDPGFTASLGERLFPPPRKKARRSSRQRPLFAGVATAGGLAAAALALSLAGVGPLSGGNGSQADSDCHYVTVIKFEDAPVIARVHGHQELQLRERSVKRRVKRCS